MKNYKVRLCLGTKRCLLFSSKYGTFTYKYKPFWASVSYTSSVVKDRESLCSMPSTITQINTKQNREMHKRTHHWECKAKLRLKDFPVYSRKW